MYEFDYINRFFSPLAKEYKGARALKDDLCILEKENYVVSKDVLTAGVHFFKDDSPELIAKKALRVNISDLVAKGAMPVGYFLGLALPQKMKIAEKELWVEKFCLGLQADQSYFNLCLLGGDSIVTLHDIVVSITMIGKVDDLQSVPSRSHAQIGDYIYVSDVLGKAAFGLRHRLGEIQLPCEAQNRCLQAYLLPDIDIALAQKILPYMNASMDISDGLLQDMQHICNESKVGAVLEIESDILPEFISPDLKNYEIALTGGDDYKILFTSSFSPEKLPKEEKIIYIGRVVQEKNMKCFVEKNPFLTDKQGYNHF